MQQPPPQPWGYQPPPRPPMPGSRWYRHPVGIALIVAVVLILVALLLPAFSGGGAPRAPATTGGFAPPAAPATTSTTVVATPATRLREAVQGELAAVGTVTAVELDPGGQVTVIWDIAPAATTGLTKNNARFAVMRIMSALKRSDAGLDYRSVRLLGRFRLAGRSTPATVVRLRFDRATVQRTDFDERRYLEAYELADAATIHPAFRG
jgi:hypothetical protein